jgi:hypothetical protein
MADYSITAVTRRVVYTGSAGVGPYAFTFPVISQTDIAVYQNSTKLILTTNYTVTVSSANGTGSVTLVVAATGSDRIVIIGARAIERTTDFVTAGDLKASSLNEQLDASIILIQQLAEENKRTLKAPQYDAAAVEDGGNVNMVLPVQADRAGKTLAFDSNGNPVVVGNSFGSGFVTITSGTGAASIPASTTANRPTPAVGYFRFNTDLNQFEGYNGTNWGAVGGGATGGGNDEIFHENDQIVTADYTIGTGSATSKNAGTFGPITVNSGITVTVPSGSTWSIV